MKAWRSSALAVLAGLSACGATAVGPALRDRRPVTQAQIASYYARHRSEFAIPERRYFEIDNLRTYARALEVKAEVEDGRSFAAVALDEQRTRGERSIAGRKRIDAAIFAARPHVLTGPILLSDVGDYSLFEVTRVVPRSYRSVGSLAGAIAMRLRAARERTAPAQLHQHVARHRGER